MRRPHQTIIFLTVGFIYNLLYFIFLSLSLFSELYFNFICHFISSAYYLFMLTQELKIRKTRDIFLIVRLYANKNNNDNIITSSVWASKRRYQHRLIYLTRHDLLNTKMLITHSCPLVVSSGTHSCRRTSLSPYWMAYPRWLLMAPPAGCGPVRGAIMAILKLFNMTDLWQTGAQTKDSPWKIFNTLINSYIDASYLLTH